MAGSTGSLQCIHTRSHSQSVAGSLATRGGVDVCVGTHRTVAVAAFVVVYEGGNPRG